MRVIIQRVKKARVCVVDEGELIEAGKISHGMALLIGVHREDTENVARSLAEKVSVLRIMEDDAGKMNLSIQDVNGSILAVSNFTLYADSRKGRRPSFEEAAKGHQAEKLYELFCDTLELRGIKVAKGVFGAHMEVELTNDGPVTLILELMAAQL